MKDRIDTLVELSSNLYDVSALNEESFRKEIQRLKSTIDGVGRGYVSAENRIYQAVVLSGNEISNNVSRNIIDKLDSAIGRANRASERFERASKYSILRLFVISTFFLIAIAGLLWFLFVKNIPTLEKIMEYQREVSELRVYGEILDCGNYKCPRMFSDEKNWTDDNKNPLYLTQPR